MMIDQIIRRGVSFQGAQDHIFFKHAVQSVLCRKELLLEHCPDGIPCLECGWREGFLQLKVAFRDADALIVAFLDDHDRYLFDHQSVGPQAFDMDVHRLKVRCILEPFDHLRRSGLPLSGIGEGKQVADFGILKHDRSASLAGQGAEAASWLDSNCSGQPPPHSARRAQPMH